MKIKNYGDLICFVAGDTLLAYQEYGSYQGDYVAVTEKDGMIRIWKDDFGSCSGCDWLEAKKDWQTDEVTKENGEQYMESKKPFLEFSVETGKELIASGKLESIFPANTRTEFEYGDLTESALVKIITESLAPTPKK